MKNQEAELRKLCAELSRIVGAFCGACERQWGPNMEGAPEEFTDARRRATDLRERIVLVQSGRPH